MTARMNCRFSRTTGLALLLALCALPGVSRATLSADFHGVQQKLDDTLLDGSRFQESIVRTCEMIAANQPGLDAARVLEANAQIWPGYWREVEEGWTLGALDTASVSLEAWRLTLGACGCGDESLAGRASQIHRQLGLESHRLFDDVRELFAAAKRARVPLALITNGASDTQREKLRVLDIEHWFLVCNGD